MANENTMSDNVLDPQVLADMVSAQLTAGAKFTPLAEVDTTLVGTPGSTIQFPSWNYIGDAEDVTEGEPIDTAKLTYGLKGAAIKEAGKGGSVTDTALEVGYGDPAKELTQQLGLSMSNKMDNDMKDALSTATQTASVAPTVEGLQSALDVFNFEDDGSTVALVCSPSAASKLRVSAAKEFVGASQLNDAISTGIYGEILGVQIIRSRKLSADEAYLVVTNATDGRPALKLIMKRDVNIEPERHADTRSTAYYATAMYAAYLYDPTKVVKVTFTGVTGPAATTGAPADQAVDETASNVPEDKRVGRQKKAKAASSNAKKPGEA